MAVSCKKGRTPTSTKAQRNMMRQIGHDQSLLGRPRTAAAQATLARHKAKHVPGPTQMALASVRIDDIVSRDHTLPSAAKLHQPGHAPFAKAMGSGGSGRTADQVRRLLAADAARRAALADASTAVQRG